VNVPLAPLLRALLAREVRFVLIGVSGANLYAPPLVPRFITEDWDLFLPTDPANLVLAWAACDDAGAELWLGEEPLDRPRDLWLGERICERRALTRVTGPGDVKVDFTLVMKGFDFEEVWKERRVFLLDGVDVPTARLRHIIESKHAAGRDKDLLFLATHKDALEQLLKRPDEK
jgi:hypothetical protein